MHVEHRRAERHNRISCCWRKDVRCMSTASQGISSGENIHMRILPYRVRSIAMGNHAPCQYKGCIDQVRPAADIPPRAWSQVADADVIPFFPHRRRTCVHASYMYARMRRKGRYPQDGSLGSRPLSVSRIRNRSGEDANTETLRLVRRHCNIMPSAHGNLSAG